MIPAVGIAKKIARLVPQVSVSDMFGCKCEPLNLGACAGGLM